MKTKKIFRRFLPKTLYRKLELIRSQHELDRLQSVQGIDGVSLPVWECNLNKLFSDTGLESKWNSLRRELTETENDGVTGGLTSAIGVRYSTWSTAYNPQGYSKLELTSVHQPFGWQVVLLTMAVQLLKRRGKS